MQTQQKVDTKALEQKISSLQKNLAFLNQGADANSLFTIIHRPGWTTPVQVALASQILDAMNRQAVAMTALRATLQQHVDSSVGA